MINYLVMMWKVQVVMNSLELKHDITFDIDIKVESRTKMTTIDKPVHTDDGFESREVAILFKHIGEQE